jgi:hypothetical protein
MGANEEVKRQPFHELEKEASCDELPQGRTSLMGELIQQTRAVLWLKFHLLYNSLLQRHWSYVMFIGLIILATAAYAIISGAGTLWLALLVQDVNFLRAFLRVFYTLVFLGWLLLPIFPGIQLSTTLDPREFFGYPISLGRLALLNVFAGFVDLWVIVFGPFLFLLCLIFPASHSWTASCFSLLLTLMFIGFTISLSSSLILYLQDKLGRKWLSRKLWVQLAIGLFAIWLLLPLTGQVSRPDFSKLITGFYRLLDSKWYAFTPPGAIADAITVLSNGDWVRAFGIALPVLSIYLATTYALNCWIIGKYWEGNGPRTWTVEGFGQSFNVFAWGPDVLLRMPWRLSHQVKAIAARELVYLSRMNLSKIRLVHVGIALVATLGLAASAPMQQDFAFHLLILASPWAVEALVSGYNFNFFSTEGWGFQSYFTYPVEPRQVILGKNLVSWSVYLVGYPLLLVAVYWLHAQRLYPLEIVYLAGVATGFSFTALATGNWLSLHLPQKVSMWAVSEWSNSFIGQLIYVAALALYLTLAIGAYYLAYERWATPSVAWAVLLLTISLLLFIYKFSIDVAARKLTDRGEDLAALVCSG